MNANNHQPMTSTAAAPQSPRPGFCRDTFHDYVVSHGFGAPLPKGYELGQQLYITGDDYATAAAETVTRGLTVELEHE